MGLEMKLRLSGLGIEATRRCNMACVHCMRGPAQNVDIEFDHIKNLFQNLSYIGRLVITGGEPSLNCTAIDWIVVCAKKLQVEIGSFYIATNGEIPDMCHFKESLEQLHEVTTNKHQNKVEISNDPYHWSTYKELLVVRERLSTLPFYVEIEEYNNNPLMLLHQGRAQKLPGVVPDFQSCLEFIVDLDEIYNGVPYLNALGYLIMNPDLSYENQRRGAICHSSEQLTPMMFRQWSLRIRRARAGTPREGRI